MNALIPSRCAIHFLLQSALAACHSLVFEIIFSIFPPEGSIPRPPSTHRLIIGPVSQTPRFAIDPVGQSDELDLQFLKIEAILFSRLCAVCLEEHHDYLISSAVSVNNIEYLLIANEISYPILKFYGPIYTKM
jgi:hypothetical protein